MSTYDPSNFLSAGQANLGLLLAKVKDELPARIAYEAIPGGIQSSSGTSVIFSQSFTCAADDIVLFFAQFTCSASSTASVLQLNSLLDGSAQYLLDKTDLPSGTGGRGESGFFLSHWKDLSAGSHTAGLQMVITGGGTVYIANLVPYIVTLKRRG